MRAAWLLTSLVVSWSAFAETPPDAGEPAPAVSPAPEKKPEAPKPAPEPRPAEPPAVGSGGLLQVGVADVGTLVTTSTNNPIGTNVFMPFTEVVFRVGAYFRQGHSLSLGIGLSYLSVSQGGNDTTLLNVTFAPTYRYHFLPLRPWQLSPFAQLELIVSVNNQSFSSPQPNVTVVPFGVSAGVGAEYLLGDRFGLVIVAGGRFTTVTSGATPGVSNTGTTVNTFQAWGSAAVSLHF